MIPRQTLRPLNKPREQAKYPLRKASKVNKPHYETRPVLEMVAMKLESTLKAVLTDPVEVALATGLVYLTSVTASEV